MERTMETEHINEAYKIGVKYFLFRNRLLNLLECMPKYEALMERQSNIKVKKFVPEDQTSKSTLTQEVFGQCPSNLVSDNEAKKLQQINGVVKLERSEEMSVTNNQRNSYSFCSETFLNAMDLKRHKHRNHKAENIFTCGKCHKSFKRQKQLKRHAKKHNSKFEVTAKVTPEESQRILPSVSSLNPLSTMNLS